MNLFAPILNQMIFLFAFILIGFVLYSKKFKIDEETYAQILADLKQREESENADAIAASADACENTQEETSDEV